MLCISNPVTASSFVVAEISLPEQHMVMVASVHGLHGLKPAKVQHIPGVHCSGITSIRTSSRLLNQVCAMLTHMARFLIKKPLRKGAEFLGRIISR